MPTMKFQYYYKITSSNTVRVHNNYIVVLYEPLELIGAGHGAYDSSSLDTWVIIELGSPSAAILDWYRQVVCTVGLLELQNNSIII